MDEPFASLARELGPPYGAHHVVMSKMAVAGVDHFILSDDSGLDVASGDEHEDDVAVADGGVRREHAMRCEHPR